MASGTKIADVYVDLGLALTQYRKGLAQAKTEATSVGAQIRAALSGPAGGTAQYSSGFARVIQDIRAGKPALDAFRANLPAVAADLRKLTVSGLSSSLNALQGVGARVFGGLRTLASNVFKGIALGAGIGAFLGIEQVISRITQAIPDLINRGREYAETVHAISLETGENAEVASRTLAIYQFFGGTTAQFETQLVRLSARVRAQEQSFNEMGVATRDANKNFLSQIQILDNVRHAFQNVGDGTDKTGFLFKAFGQRGAQALEPLIHFVGQTDEQVRQLGLHVTEQGLVITDEEERIADAVTRAQSNMGNAITGFATKLFLSFGPALSDFFDTLAEAITRNAAQIQQALAGVIGTVVGLIEGLVGMSGSLDSFSKGFAHVNVTTSDTSTALRDLEQHLVDLKAKLDPAGLAADQLNAGIDAQTKAIDRESAAIDKQITRLKSIGDAREAAWKRGLDSLSKAVGLETALLDAEDKAAGRADQDLAQTRALRDAKVALFEAQAQLRADALAGKSTDQDVLNIAKAQQDVLDAQKAITDQAASRARDDRRTQINATQGYVGSIEKIVADSENRKAALATLGRRKARLEEEIAAAQAKGNAQEVSDLKVKLAAVESGITEEQAKIKQGATIDELTKTKQQLADEKARLQAGKTSASDINREALAAEIDQTQTLIDKEKARLVGQRENATVAGMLHRGERDDLATIAKATDGAPNSVTAAMEAARRKGVTMADDWKTHLGGVLDTIGSIAGALGGIFKGLIDAFNNLPGPLRGIVAGAGVAALASGGNPFAIAAGAIAGGTIQLQNLGSENEATKAKILADAAEFGRTGSLTDIQNEWRALIRQKEQYPQIGRYPDPRAVYLQQIIDILGKAIASRFPSGPPNRLGERASGGWASMGLYRLGERGREYVLDHALSEKLDRFFSPPQMPALAMAGVGLGGRVPPHSHDVYMDGKLVSTLVDRELGFRSGR